MKHVLLIPGFMSSDLGIFATGDKIWWEPSVTAILGIGSMRLAPDGISPQPPDGKQMGVDTVPQLPWSLIKDTLISQLDRDVWQMQVLPWDWRRDINDAADFLAGDIRRIGSVNDPVTIVGHSAGGLMAVLAWSKLEASGDSDLVRRIITICTPFQGSYAPISWLNGSLPSVVQLLAANLWSGFAAINPAVNWTLEFLNGVALTWPCFYQLYPSMIGSEAGPDVNRFRLYNQELYPPNVVPSVARLASVQQFWQPQISALNTFPPPWVATYVVGTGLPTPYRLRSSSTPLNLNDVTLTNSGDSVVTTESATRSPGKVVSIPGDHSSIPLAIATSGLLASLITDPRGPPDPPPPPIMIQTPIAQNMTPPPESDYVTGLSCLGGNCLRLWDASFSRFII